MLYTNIKSDIIQCTSCPLSKDLDYGCLPQWGMGSKTAKTLVLNLRSSQESHLVEKPLEPKYSLLLHKMVEAANMKDTDIFVTNLLKCKCPLTPKKQFKENVSTCRQQWLLKELQSLPTINNIVCFGHTTADMLLCETDNPNVFESSERRYYNIRTFITYSFEEIFRKSQSYMNHAIETLKYAKEHNAKVEENR